MITKLNIFDDNLIMFSGYNGKVHNYNKIEYVIKQHKFDGITIFTDNPLIYRK